MSLEVIGPGFGRTGTKSLKQALETLGFGPCHHMTEGFVNPGQVPFWQAVAIAGPMLWGEPFKGYRSQVDWPGAHIWRELAAGYPQAKVVLSVRPEQSWWNSFNSTIGAMMAGPGLGAMPPHVQSMLAAGRTMVEVQTFHCPLDDKEGALKAYRRRTEEVRATIAPERLLEFDVAEGWTPLCRFLGVPVPDAPFPRINTTAEFQERVRGMQAGATGHDLRH